jgi:hypothetical protein
MRLAEKLDWKGLKYLNNHYKLYLLVLDAEYFLEVKDHKQGVNKKLKLPYLLTYSMEQSPS